MTDMKTKLKMRMGDQIVAAWGEHAAGPGWSSMICNILIRDVDGTFRAVIFNSRELPGELQMLLEVSSAANAAMIASINAQRHKEARHD